MKKHLHRPLGIILGLVLILGIFPLSVLAAGTGGEGPVTNGAYDADGVWHAGGNGTVSYDVGGSEVILSKTAAPVPGEENTYDITLRVETGTVVHTVPSAVVLVIDTSGSMAYCAECGGDGHHSRDCQYSGGVSGTQTRLAAAKEAALEFLSSYAGTDGSAERLLSIVTFDSGYRTKLNWVNTAGGSDTAGYRRAAEVIQALRAGGGTNLEGGLYTASAELGASAVEGIDAKFVILLTDGVPTYRMDGGSGSSGSAENNAAAKRQAQVIHSKGATLYTVCFGDADERTYTGEPEGPTVGDFLRNDIASSPADAYDADDTDTLLEAFESITESITTGLDGCGWTATDPMAEGIRVTGSPPEEFAPVDGTVYIWTLGEPEVRTDGNVTTYIYTCTYRVIFDPSFDGFEEGQFYPTNAPTFLNIGDAQYASPVPGVTGVTQRTCVSVTKIWDDCGDQDGIRPDSITVLLLADGEPTGKYLVLSGENGWTGSFTGLDRYRNGTEIHYTVDEFSVDGYTTRIDGAQDTGFTLTNCHTPAVTSVSVSKIWDDCGNRDGARPEQVTVRLYAGGTDTGLSLILSDENGWAGTFEKLPKYDGGKEILYTVTEDAVKDYTTRIDGSAKNGFTVTNSYDTVPKTGDYASAVWIPLVLLTGAALLTLGLSCRKRFRFGH